jgi:ADP-ribose pyrophosphatase
MESNPWTILNKNKIYQNNWLELEEYQVLNPAGNPGIYGVVRFASYAICVVPVDDAGYTWLVGQYRFPLDVYSWEIPEGGGHKDIDPDISARRELQEETGLIAEHMTCIGTYQVSNSCTDEIAYLFMATGLTEGPSMPEETEDLRLQRIPITEAIDMALDGRIQDAMSVLGLLRVKLILGL